MLDAVLAPVELSEIGELGTDCLQSFLVEGDSIGCNLVETDTTDGAYLSAEVGLQQTLAQADALEYLRTTIGTDGRDTHLRHDLKQTFLHCLDIVLLCSLVVFLYLVLLHQVVEDGESHIWA